MRSQQRGAYHALLQASSRARKRLARDERLIGTDLPGGTGVLPTWGRPLQDPPHLHALVPGGGLAEDRTTWRPCRAHCFVPVKALAPLSRALFKEDMRQAGVLEHIAPQVWAIPWNVHRQAHHHGHSAFPSRAPAVFKGALSHSRIVGLTDRTVTFPSRQGGRTRPRTAHLDVMAFLRRCLQHVLPDGFQQVRHCGLLQASGAVPLATIRLMRGQGPSSDALAPQRQPLPQPAARWPTCGAPMRVVMRLGTSNCAFVDTG
jgi:hypothetical protein